MFKKICAVAVITAAAVFGTAGVASADTAGTELRGWTWWLGGEVAELADDVANLVVDVDDEGEVTILGGWTWW